MKTKATILILLTVLLTSITSIVIPVKAGTATIYVDPVSSTAPLGETFSISINIADVDDLFAWGTRIGWDPDMLDVTNVEEGPFMKGQPMGSGFTKVINNVEGYVDMGCTTIGDYPGVDGSGTLATVFFSVEAEGKSVLDIYGSSLLDYDLDEIPHTAEDGYFSNLPPGLKFPTVFFTHSPSTPLSNETVTFDASKSHDADGCIVSYYWDFDDGTTLTETDPIADHIYDEPGSYHVALTVTDNDGLSDTTTEWVHVFSPPPPVHDVSVADITAYPTAVPTGELVYIDVTVENQGDFIEDFDVTVSARHRVTGAVIYIGTKTIYDLLPGASGILNFVWDTTGASLGNYSIIAEAIVPEDDDPEDNTYIAFGIIGGIYAPRQEHQINILAYLVQIIPTIFLVVALGIAGIGLFRILGSPRLTWPMRLSCRGS